MRLENGVDWLLDAEPRPAQVEALGREGDCLIAISTSGNSKNVVLAIEEAQRRGMKVLAWTGRKGGRCAELADVAVKVPSDVVAHIQEGHIALGHILCELIERLALGRE